MRYKSNTVVEVIYQDGSYELLGGLLNMGHSDDLRFFMLDIKLKDIYLIRVKSEYSIKVIDTELYNYQKIENLEICVPRINLLSCENNIVHNIHLINTKVDDIIVYKNANIYMDNSGVFNTHLLQLEELRYAV